MIKILLADDHALVRQGFRMILEAQPDMEIVGQAGNGREAVELASKLHPDVAVMDVAMPELNGMEFCRRITDPSIRKIVLTGKADEHVAVKSFNEGLIDRFIRRIHPRGRLSVPRV